MVFLYLACYLKGSLQIKTLTFVASGGLEEGHPLPLGHLGEGLPQAPADGLELGFFRSEWDMNPSCKN